MAGIQRGDDPVVSWRKHTVGIGVFGEGLSTGDIDGDGRVEIVEKET